LELNSGGTDAVVEVYAKNEPEKKLKVIEDSKNLSIEFYRMAFPTRSKLSPELDKAVEKSFLNKAL
jgi:polar amino acid transport system substrate-binding protein